ALSAAARPERGDCPGPSRTRGLPAGDPRAAAPRQGVRFAADVSGARHVRARGGGPRAPRLYRVAAVPREEYRILVRRARRARARGGTQSRPGGARRYVERTASQGSCDGARSLRDPEARATRRAFSFARASLRRGSLAHDRRWTSAREGEPRTRKTRAAWPKSTGIARCAASAGLWRGRAGGRQGTLAASDRVPGESKALRRGALAAAHAVGAPDARRTRRISAKRVSCIQGAVAVSPGAEGDLHSHADLDAVARPAFGDRPRVPAVAAPVETARRA